MKICAQPTCSVLDVVPQPPQPPKPPKPPKPIQSPILPPPNLKLTSQNWLATTGTSRIQCYPSHRFPKHLPNAKAHVPWQAGTHQHIAAFGNLPWEPQQALSNQPQTARDCEGTLNGMNLPIGYRLWGSQPMKFQEFSRDV